LSSGLLLIARATIVDEDLRRPRIVVDRQSLQVVADITVVTITTLEIRCRITTIIRNTITGIRCLAYPVVTLRNACLLTSG
jgi:hypothetical protein